MIHWLKPFLRPDPGWSAWHVKLNLVNLTKMLETHGPYRIQTLNNDLDDFSIGTHSWSKSRKAARTSGRLMIFCLVLSAVEYFDPSAPFAFHRLILHSV